jgi:hypothetical protein
MAVGKILVRMEVLAMEISVQEVVGKILEWMERLLLYLEVLAMEILVQEVVGKKLVLLVVVQI